GTTINASTPPWATNHPKNSRPPTTPASNPRERQPAPSQKPRNQTQDNSTYNSCMQTLPLSTVKAKLSELVDSASTTHDQVVITKNGSPAAIIVGTDEWESIQETLYWLSQPGIREDLALAQQDIAEGNVFSEEQIRAEFGVPKTQAS
ncbi:type II toxin-antitoxin system Phd/YefM family antitoxin, partial [Acaricomes phytoseiuli]|uniref:type II toxin-antitoxin system Phd/YefM family antitoxin n=2 Tax=Acaricomes phytoseiuli TaxID=291968 RepID=UPI0029CA6E93